MAFNLSNANIPSIKNLRSLIIKNLPSIIEGCHIIDPELPIPGEPILALNSNSKPMLICFHTVNPFQALKSGLTAVSYARQQHRLISRLHPQLNLGDSGESIILVLITSERIPGDDSCFRQDGSILFYTFQGISLDGETVLLIEPAPFNYIKKIETTLLSNHEKEYFHDL